MFKFDTKHRGCRVAIIMMLVIVITLVESIPISAQDVVQEKTKKSVKGTDGNGIKWNFNKKTKTLTFQGKGEMYEVIIDGHGPEPEWYCWGDETEHIVIKEGITYLTSYAFDSFVNVKTVDIADTVSRIGADAFFGCQSLQKVKMSKNVNKIEDGAFSCCEKLKQITIPKKVEYIGENAFSCCESISEIIIPDSVNFIGSGAFSGCKKLKSVQLPKNLKTIHADMFGHCEKLKSVTIPQSVQTIYDGAFRNSGIETIVIPKNVTKFKYEGFDHGIFEDCMNLTKVTIKSKKLTKCYKNAFQNFPEDAVIYVPKGKKKDYAKLFYASRLEKEVKIKELK